MPVDELENDGSSPLYHAVDNHNVPLTSYFIEKGADSNEKSKDIFCTWQLCAIIWIWWTCYKKPELMSMPIIIWITQHSMELALYVMLK